MNKPIRRTAWFAIGLFFVVPLGASGAAKRHAHSHVHGSAEVTLAVEGRKIIIELRTPTEGLMGFEHEAKTDAEKKKRDAAVKILETSFDELVLLDKKLGCKAAPGKVVIVQPEPTDDQGKKGGEHREARATYDYECAQAPAGSRVRFAVTKLFPAIHELKVQVLSDTKQSGATIKRDRGDVGL